MKANVIAVYLTKFVTAELDDGSEVSGYISNAEEIKQAGEGDLDIILVNGLQNSQVPSYRIMRIHEAVREDTLKIPIITESGDLYKKKPETMEEKLDELFDKSLSDTLEVRLPNGKVIDNRKK